MSKPRSRSSQQPHDRQRRRQQRRLVTETLESRAMMAVDTNPWHNDSFPGDVDQDRTFTPLDALLVVNDLNTFGSRSLLASTYPATSTPKASGGEPEATSFKVDVNNDNWVTPQDALRLINLLNGEGESPQVQILVSALKLDGTALDIPSGASLPTVQVGTKFLIRAKVKDARTVPTGVDSAFLDVIYNQSTVRVDLRENQMISVDRGQKAEGKFRLTLRNPVTNVQETTADITYAYGTKPIPDQTQFNIQKALEDLAIVEKEEVIVESPPNTQPLPGADARFDFIVRFGGKYANTNVAEMTVTNVSMAKTPTVSQVSGTTAGGRHLVPRLALPGWSRSPSRPRLLKRWPEVRLILRGLMVLWGTSETTP